MFAFADEKRIDEIISSDKGLRDFIDQEIDRMTDEGLIKNCGGCGHGEGDHKCGGCCGKRTHGPDAAYLTTALISIFNYYIPDKIKNAINLGGSTFIDKQE